MLRVAVGLALIAAAYAAGPAIVVVGESVARIIFSKLDKIRLRQIR